MEIATALQFALDDPKHIFIFSDSRSVLQAIFFKDYRIKSSHLIWTIRKLLFELKQLGKDVQLVWIPAHVGIEGNEMANSAAKDAVTIGTDTQFLLPYSDFKSLWKEKLFSNFHDWAQTRGSHKGYYYFENFFKPKKKPWFQALPSKRKGMVSFNRLRAGHTVLAECLWRHNIIDSPFCDCDMMPQTANHVFWQCPILEDQRVILLRTITLSFPFGPY